MRVLHVSDVYLPRIGGIETQVHGLACAQTAAGEDVHVLTATGSAVEDRGGAAVAVHRIGRRGPWRRASPLVQPQALRAAAALLGEIDPDVVHVHASVVSPLPLAAALAAARTGRPTVVTVHSMWAHLSTGYRALATATGLSRLPIEWTAVSHAAAQPVQQVVGSARRVHVLPNGIDAEYWQRTPRASGGRQLVVAAVMRLTARKRPLAVLAALRAARAMLPPQIRVRSVIIGGGPQRRLLQAYHTVHRMRDWVWLCGPNDRDQVRQLLARADVFVAAARLESFGVAALEARCAGVPVIARRGTGISDFVRHGHDGLLVSTDADLAAALTRVLGSPDIRQAMTKHTRLPPSGFGWAQILAAATRAYQRAAAATELPAIPPVSAIG